MSKLPITVKVHASLLQNFQRPQYVQLTVSRNLKPDNLIFETLVPHMIEAGLQFKPAVLETKDEMKVWITPNHFFLTTEVFHEGDNIELGKLTDIPYIGVQYSPAPREAEDSDEMIAQCEEGKWPAWAEESEPRRA